MVKSSKDIFIQQHLNGSNEKKQEEKLSHEEVEFPFDNLFTEIPTILVIGSTGTGKSSFCNSISGQRNFQTSASATSFTYETKGCQVNWFNDKSKEGQFLLIDTPGLGDSNNRDSQHIADMVAYLRTQKLINAVLLIFNGQMPRFDENLQSLIKIFAQIFGVNFLQNTAIVFTRWSQSRKDVQLRTNNKDTESSKQICFNKYINDLLGTKIHIPSFFIDNSLNDQNNYEFLEQQEIKLYQESLEDIKKFCLSKQPFDCRDIQEVQSEKDQYKTIILLKQQELLEQEKIQKEKQAQYQQELLLKEQSKIRQKEQNEQLITKIKFEEEQKKREQAENQEQLQKLSREQKEKDELLEKLRKQRAQEEIKAQQQQQRLRYGGCRKCQCLKYKYSFKQTKFEGNSPDHIDDGEKVGFVVKGTAKILTLNIADIVAENRCQCTHWESQHGL